ncbi:hypothetical protein ANCCEY_12881 [Ancylostoma ceylanicum]|uniref:Reverse transcriptase domain-containing protein n=1 Tax=Ancylostoma ceylanicum TaxID=53326 RepID=A0A0D6LDN3_9BILA|nr:hypothetical protein ANCCEY_12881 [Ancylostoma ceylanicum]
MHALKQIPEKSREYNFPAYVALVDYKKASDSSGYYSKRHQTSDTMSPKLSNATLRMVLEYIEWETCGHRIGGKILSSLEYADDVALLASARSMLGKMMRLLEAASAEKKMVGNSVVTDSISTKETVYATLSTRNSTSDIRATLERHERDTAGCTFRVEFLGRN